VVSALIIAAAIFFSVRRRQMTSKSEQKVE
jgi:hypothetical protein